jgi:hypothetical protein
VIDFRYHLVSIIAIFMALAVGIVLGSGPLKGPIDETLSQQAEQLRQDKENLREQISALQRERQYDDDVTEAVTPALTGNRLAGKRAVVLTAPDADGGLVEALTASLRDAGAEVTGTVNLTNSWLDPGKETELTDATAPFVVAGTRFPDGDEPRQRADAALADSLLTTDAAAAGKADDDTRALLAALEELDMITVEGEPARPATLALVVAGPAPAAPDQASAAKVSGLLDLAISLDRQGEGTLVAGPVAAAADGGLIAAVRRSGAARAEVSTVDSAPTTAGRLSVLLGLAAEARDRAGAYGYGPKADDVLPDLGSTAPAS